MSLTSELLSYSSGRRSELEAVARAATPVLAVTAALSVVAIPVVLRKRRRESFVAVAAALLSVAIGVVVVAWFL